MKRIALYLASIVALLSVSCEPVGNGGGDSELKVTRYSVGGVETTFNSVAVMMVGENISIVATPEQG